MKKRKFTCLLFLAGLLIQQCMPDRMPSAPVEIDRPQFVQFAAEDSGGFAVGLRDPVTMVFNETMELSTFPANFTLESLQGVIPGTFSHQDSIVVFMPSEDMAAAAYYEATIRGGVRDANGNTLTLDTEWKADTWFFTAGQYSENGFPHVFIADRSFDKLYLVGNFNEFLNESAEVIQPRGMAFSPDDQHLLVVSKQLDGQLSVLNPATFSKMQDVPVGTGPEELAVAPDKIFVVNVSGKTISVLGFPGYNPISTISFQDGFSPRDIAYNPANNRIYASNNVLNKPGILKVLDADTYQELSTLENLISGRRTEKLQTSTDGQWVVIQQEQTDLILLLDVNSNQVADSIFIPVPQNKDMDIYDNKLFVSSSGGILFKYDLNSGVLLDTLAFPSRCDGVAVAPYGEILYVTTPVDTLVHAVDIETLHLIRSVKMTASTIAKLIVSPENYASP
jgi:DNA-binding beta-propeller fold protein YncE